MTKPAVSPAPFPAVRTRLAAPEFEIVRGGFATAYAATAGRPIQMSGCLYRADGTKVALSERASGHRGDHVRASTPTGCRGRRTPRRCRDAGSISVTT